MRLNPRQLATHLRAGVAPLYLLSGDEPLLVDEALDAIRAAARQSGCTERDVQIAERGFDWDEFRAGLGNLSLFASRQLIELRLPTGKPGDRGARELVALAADPPADKVVVVITPALAGKAAKTRWVTTLADAGVWVPLVTPNREQLPAWLAGRLKSAGLACDPDALTLLVDRVEGNLLAAKQEIDKLLLLTPGEPVTVDTVRAAVADGARYDVFQLADAALAGDGQRAARILTHLEREGVAPTLALWSLARDIFTLVEVAHRLSAGDAPGRAMTAAGVWRSREALIGKAIRRGGVRRLLQQARIADRVVKGARPGQPWSALMELTLSLAGTDAPVAQTA